jgi:hypothetical protein
MTSVELQQLTRAAADFEAFVKLGGEDGIANSKFPKYVTFPGADNANVDPMLDGQSSSVQQGWGALKKLQSSVTKVKSSSWQKSVQVLDAEDEGRRAEAVRLAGAGRGAQKKEKAMKKKGSVKKEAGSPEDDDGGVEASVGSTTAENNSASSGSESAGSGPKKSTKPEELRTIFKTLFPCMRKMIRLGSAAGMEGTGTEISGGRGKKNNNLSAVHDTNTNPTSDFSTSTLTQYADFPLDTMATYLDCVTIFFVPTGLPVHEINADLVAALKNVRRGL